MLRLRAAVFSLVLLTGCNPTITGGGSTSGGGAGQGGAASSGGIGGAGSQTAATSGGAGGAGSAQSTGAAGGMTCPLPAVEAQCANHLYQCGDTIDNDGDGLVDSQDPDCMGACDNSEDAYHGNIPGRLGPSCSVDCYWDQDAGPGNDDCYWSHRCDPNETIAPGHPEPFAKCAYDPSFIIQPVDATCADLEATQSSNCLNYCMPLTPNGCDCFGCCELPAGSGKFVWFGSKDEATGIYHCKADVVDDPDKCEPCTPVPSCLNTCEKCEKCVGKPNLPPECVGQDGKPEQTCPDNAQRCGLDCQEACPAGSYCITGCCQPIPT